MSHKIARTGLMLFLAFVVAIPVPLFAQNDNSDQTNTSSKDKDQDKDKSKSKQKSKKKNSDVENIGNRNINKGSLNFFSLEKEIQMGRQLAAEIERLRGRQKMSATLYAELVGTVAQARTAVEAYRP